MVGAAFGALALMTGMLEIGALPAGAVASGHYVVNTTSSVGSSPANCASGTGACDLQDAVAAYNTDGLNQYGITTETITFSATLPSPSTFVTGAINLANASGQGLTITGAGTSSTLISGSFVDTNTGPVTISGVTIENGNSASSGGGVSNTGAGALALSNVNLTTNTAANSGGAIYNTGALTLSNVTMTGNKATTGSGGGLYNSGVVTVTGLTANLNSSGTGGAGIYNAAGGTITGTGFTVSSNTAAAGGCGGLDNLGTLSMGTSSVSGGSISGNSGVAGAGNGGGLCNGAASASATLQGVTVSNNLAGAQGGGIYNLGTLSMTAGSVNGNTATTNGGGIYTNYNLAGVGATFTNVSISSNQATGGNGGGIYDDTSGGGITVTGGSITNNSAPNVGTGSGGGVWLGPTAANAESTFNGVTITLNTAAVSGGGIYQNAGGLLLNNATAVTYNTASAGGGGGLYLGGSGGYTCSNTVVLTLAPPTPIPPANVCLAGVSVSYNTAPNTSSGAAPAGDGAGIYNGAASLLTTTSTVSNNTAGSQGGGIWSGPPSGSPVATILATTISSNRIVAGNTSNQRGAGFYGGSVLPYQSMIAFSTVSGNAIVPTAPSPNDAGAGINNNSGLVLLNDTVANNQGAYNGGGIWTLAPLSLTNVTISGNSANLTGGSGGGIFVAGPPPVLTGTILANDTAGITGSANECAGGPPVTSGGYNDDQGNTCGFTSITDHSATNPVLGPLANNGGPTQTMALLAGSPVIGAESGAFCPQYDQRGVARPHPCDIGAYQSSGVVPSPVTVTSVSPNSGPPVGGSLVTITGTGFSTTPGATAIAFGAIAATNVSCSSTTTCTATSPAGTGTVDVRATVASTTSPPNPPGDQFTYTTALTVSALSPISGPTVGGTVVSITGTGFSTTPGATTFAFGLVAATNVSCSSTTHCTATSPAGTGTVDVRATVAGSTSLANPPADQFTYVNVSQVTQLYGTDPIGTSIAISQAEFPTSASASAVVLARDDFFSDALAGGPLAAYVHGPMLLTEGAPISSSIDPRTLAEIQRVLPAGGTVYILGGNLAISPNVDSTLSSLGYHVVREAGANEYATAVDIAQQMGNPTTIFEATGTSYYDALSAVPAAITHGAAILLTNGPTQSPETALYLLAHPGDVRYAIGGPLAAAGADPAATPVYGANLYATSAAVASTFFPFATLFGAATSATFTDALGGGVFMATGGRSGPLLIVNPSAPLPPDILPYLASLAPGTPGVVFGGPLAIGPSVIAALEAAVG